MSYQKDFSVLIELTADIGKETREAAIAIDTGVVLETPVDTGRAKGNWITSVDSPNSFADITYTAERTVAEQFAISQCKQEVQKVQGFATVYIQNNLPYITRLNEGHSDQAGSKYIEIILEKVANAR